MLRFSFLPWPEGGRVAIKSCLSSPVVPGQSKYSCHLFTSGRTNGETMGFANSRYLSVLCHLIQQTPPAPSSARPTLRSGIRGIKQASPTEVAEVDTQDSDTGQLMLKGTTHRHPPQFHRGHWVPGEKMALDGALPDEPEAHVGGTVKLLPCALGQPRGSKPQAWGCQQPPCGSRRRARQDDGGLSRCLDAPVTSGPGAPLPRPPRPQSLGTSYAFPPTCTD